MTDIPATSAGLRAEYERTVAAYVAAGGEESVQRVITALFGLTRRLDVWYHRQLVDLGISQGEWAVLSHLAKSSGGPLSPGRLAELTGVAASSMTHRLDKMCAAGLVRRSVDEANRTRVRVHLDDAGWRVFDAAVREADVVETDVLSGLTDRQRVELGRLLERAIAGIDALGDPRH